MTWPIGGIVGIIVMIFITKALVHSKYLAALALSRRSCARARTHAQFFQDLGLALKTFERRSILRSFQVSENLSIEFYTWVFHYQIGFSGKEFPDF